MGWVTWPHPRYLLSSITFKHAQQTRTYNRTQTIWCAFNLSNRQSIFTRTGIYRLVFAISSSGRPRQRKDWNLSTGCCMLSSNLKQTETIWSAGQYKWANNSLRTGQWGDKQAETSLQAALKVLTHLSGRLVSRRADRGLEHLLHLWPRDLLLLRPPGHWHQGYPEQQRGAWWVVRFLGWF